VCEKVDRKLSVATNPIDFCRPNSFSGPSYSVDQKIRNILYRENTSNASKNLNINDLYTLNILSAI